MKLSHFPDRFSQCNGQGTCRHVRGQTEASVCCARVLHVLAARLPSNLARSAEHAQSKGHSAVCELVLAALRVPEVVELL